MYFADFKNLKIIKEFNYKTIDIRFVLSKEQLSFKTLNDIINSKIDDIKPDCDLATFFNISIEFDFDATEEEKTDITLTLANTLVPSLLQHLETGKGYQRERRLGAPEHLKVLHTTQSVIKRATNYAMYPSTLNIRIVVDDMIYWFCDGKKEQEASSDE